MGAMLVSAMLALAMLPLQLLALPLLLFPLSEELTLVPDVMSPTLPESFMSPRGRLRLMPSTVHMVLATLDWDTLVWVMVMPVLATLPLLLPLWPLSLPLLQLLPATPTFPPLPLSPPLELPLLPSLLLEELTLVPDVTSPTLLESSMSPRGRLRLILTFWDTAATQATDTPASAMPVTATASLATAPTPPLLV